MATFDINKYIQEQGSQETLPSLMKPEKEEEPDKLTDFYRRFSQGIYDAFPDKEKFKSTFGPKIRQSDINWDEVREYTRNADMQDAIESSVSEALGILEQEPAKQAQDQALATLLDVTDTDEGELSNPEPLYDMAKEGAIETKELGLMSKPLTDDDMGLPKERSSVETDISFTNAFLDQMAESEGTEDHVDSLGIRTLGYGVLPATARNYGFDPDSEKYKDRKVLAKAVYEKMYSDAKESYPDVFDGLNEKQKIGVLSLYINLGQLPNGVVTALSQDNPDFDAAKTSLASVVLGSPRDKDGNRMKDKDNKIIYTSSKGLSKRRAKEYNTLMKGQEGFKPVATVSVEGSKQSPVFVWKDADGNEIHRYTPSVSGSNKVYQGLDSKSSMKTVTV